MTEKLYYKDSYIKEFDAEIISVIKNEDVYDIVLDKTAFFPEAGGQTSDKGSIGDAHVFDVKEIDGIIHHYAKEALNANKSVHCVLDFDERFKKMQCHTAEHIVSGIFHSLYGIENVGFHLGARDVTLDTSLPITSEMLARVESLANEAVYKNARVTVKYPKSEELEKLEYRAKLDLTENVRIVDIEGYDSCACCAPHVAYAGEIGLIKFIDFVGHKGGSRIRMLAGARAYEYIRAVWEQAVGVSAVLSAPAVKIKEAVESTLAAKSELEYKISSQGKQTAKILAENLSITDGNCVVYYPMLDMDALRTFVNEASGKISGTLVALIGIEGDYKYVLSSNSDTFQDDVKKANAALLGKGGGRAPMACGTYAASLADIRKFYGVK